jgi:nitrite reductase/ring-hydroxylating ferredoxin subunit
MNDAASGRLLVARAEVLVDGRAVVDAGDREIVVLEVDGALHAFDNACPHQGNPLVDGEVLGDVLECAYHGWRFDLATGACLAGDGPARRYQAERVGGELHIRLEEADPPAT